MPELIKKRSQCTDTVYMVRPSHFGYNPETAGTNAFQYDVQGLDLVSVLREFDQAQEKIAGRNIRIITSSQAETSVSKDAIFPNNWFTTHHDGTVFIYPMCAASRRDEINENITGLLAKNEFLCRDLADLRTNARKDQYLEGTGSIVFDHTCSAGYMTPGPRSDLQLFLELCRKLQYDAVTLKNTESPSVYHTNVMMMIGEKFCIICDEIIDPETDRSRIIDSLEATGREIVRISRKQMAGFCANALQLQTPDGPVLAISDTSVRELQRDQIKILERYADLCVVNIPLIEKAGGGSIRCMMAEVFLPKILKSNAGFAVVRPAGNMMEDYFRVRWECLRKPWGKAKGSEMGDDEDSADHFCVVSAFNGDVIACGRSHRISVDTLQFRYMAVSENYRGQGLGKLLIAAMEDAARQNGISRVILQARENAVEFYESNGYRIEEKTYILFDTIQHFKMVKDLL